LSRVSASCSDDPDPDGLDAVHPAARLVAALDESDNSPMRRRARALIRFANEFLIAESCELQAVDRGGADTQALAG